MKIQPNPSGQTPRPGIDRTAPSPARPADRQSPAPPGLTFDPAARDNVELSNEARELQRRSEAGAPEATIEPGRFREVLDRIASGWYERDDVRDAVVERIRKEL